MTTTSRTSIVGLKCKALVRFRVDGAEEMHGNASTHKGKQFRAKGERLRSSSTRIDVNYAKSSVGCRGGFSKKNILSRFWCSVRHPNDRGGSEALPGHTNSASTLNILSLYILKLARARRCTRG